MSFDAGEQFDVAVVGAGIAGASAAAELAALSLRVLLIEREDQPGYHTTGRSAALFSQTYGPPVIRALSRASAAFFHAPPEGFASHPILSPRDVLIVGRDDQSAAIEVEFAEHAKHAGMIRLTTAEALIRMPLLRPETAAGALLDPRSADMDVHALHHGYLRRFRVAGGTVATGSDVQAIDRDRTGWRIITGRGAYRAAIIINAAGAWADEIAALAGAAPIGLVPKRRTAMVVPAPEGAAADSLPMVVDVDEQFYLKPDAGRLLISPADETPSPPCDAQPDELDIAICIDRIETAFDLKVTRIDNRWAGLRSFVADKRPVVGFDFAVEGFFWLAGQGGYGIQTAPAMARLAAALAAGRAVPTDILDQGVDPADITPVRFSSRETASA